MRVNITGLRGVRSLNDCGNRLKPNAVRDYSNGFVRMRAFKFIQERSETILCVLIAFAVREWSFI
jgi:hypothetical protein